MKMENLDNLRLLPLTQPQARKGYNQRPTMKWMNNTPQYWGKDRNSVLRRVLATRAFWKFSSRPDRRN